MVNEKKVIEAQNTIRELINWIEVFAEEYEISEEATDVLEDKLRELSAMIDEAVED